MTLTPSTISAAIGKALCESMREELETLKLVSLSEAATLLDVSERTVAKLTAGEVVDVGGKGMKVKLSTLKRIIDERTLRV
jgi:dihydroxyacetone kinase-like predicted kinase